MYNPQCQLDRSSYEALVLGFFSLFYGFLVDSAHLPATFATVESKFGRKIAQIQSLPQSTLAFICLK